VEVDFVASIVNVIAIVALIFAECICFDAEKWPFNRFGLERDELGGFVR
jgi:hypothetical protein